jgi:hypothetical protein
MNLVRRYFRRIMNMEMMKMVVWWACTYYFDDDRGRAPSPTPTGRKQRRRREGRVGGDCMREASFLTNLPVGIC